MEKDLFLSAVNLPIQYSYLQLLPDSLELLFALEALLLALDVLLLELEALLLALFLFEAWFLLFAFVD
ncbi:MAG: hypothetical protein Q4D45_00110 [Lachnospiraceae bacterium]|nr:hypothetical protein [Lachnospiraceae bacterium]